MSRELITRREAARRLGVAPAQVRKAIKKGELSPVEKNGKTYVDWSKTEELWKSKDSSLRAFVGSKGGKERSNDRPRVELLTVVGQSNLRGEVAEQLVAATDSGEDSDGETPAIAISAARKAALDVELRALALAEKRKELISAEQVRSDMATLGVTLQSILYSIPDRISSDLAGMTDAHAIREVLKVELRRAIKLARKRLAARRDES
jgi:hypothetical protein